MLTSSVLMVMACGEAETVPQVATRDSAGVVVVESLRPAWGDSVAWTVDVDPLLDLSRSGTGPAHEFYGVRGAIRLRDGSVVVASEGTYDVRRFDGDGVHELSVGGEGDGPGEFRRVTSIHRYRGDSLAIVDRGQGRVTILDEEGWPGRTMSPDVAYGRPVGVQPVGDGRFVLHASAADVMELEEGRVRIPEVLLLLTPTGELVDTLADVAGPETFVFAFGDARVPFAKRGHAALHDGLLFVGDADEAEYRAHDLTGALKTIVRIEGYGFPVTEEERDSAVQDIRSRRVPAGLEELPERMISTLPDRKPAYGDLLIDSEGSVWLGEYANASDGSGEREWLVVDANGLWLGRVSMPTRLQPYEIGADFVLGRWEDDRGVESVRLWALHREDR